MDPVIQPNRLYVWQGVDAAADASADPSLRQLREERLLASALYHHQPEETQRSLERQAVFIAGALLDFQSRLNFTLPEFVSLPDGRTGDYRRVEVPADFRRQNVAGFLGRLPLKDVRSAFRRRLSTLEESMYPAVAASAGLLRYAVARHIVWDRIPQATAEEIFREIDALQRPDGPGGDGREHISLESIERKVDESRRSLETLHQALSLAPYIYTDEDYQAKRAGVVNQLIPLGRTLAHRYVVRMIETIDRRAEENDLNRGLRLSLPYFDDRALELKLHEFEVIPPGRTMFVPAFVALAAVREQDAVEQNDALSPSTRMHLLEELKKLQRAFTPAAF
jgi:hypothetical protein